MSNGQRGCIIDIVRERENVEEEEVEEEVRR